jgi:Putative prokaryotic signal transducing protein
MNDERWVEVYRGGGGPSQAELIRSLLEGSDIACVIDGFGMGGAYPVNVGGLAEFKVHVKESDAEDAAALLRDTL